MTPNNPQYDVALSFLSRDVGLALQIQTKLSESMKVFVYSKRQKELAGTDGLESFREAFLTNSRLAVVLYRDGWGQTPWTRIEEGAIKDRFLKEGWAWLLFVMLDEASTPPVWLPKSQIRLNFAAYGLEQLLGAIKMRAQKLGSTLKKETAFDRAKRLDQESRARAERQRLLSEKGATAVRQEHQELQRLLDSKIQETSQNLASVKLEQGSDGHEYLLRTQHVSVNFYLYITSPVTDSRIVLQEFNGPLILPKDRGRRMFVPGEEPQVISKKEFHFDYQPSLGWCWKQPGTADDFLTTFQLAEYVLKILLELHDRFENGKIPQRGPSGHTISGPNSWMA
ncbi:MAG: hypothetical protein HY645_00255 [Acidobacteria bacterium]|nr:hypothetical protein [Acidobacteriota bacterium]